MADLDELLNKGLLADAGGVSAQTRSILAGESFSEIISFGSDTFITYQGREPEALYFTLSGLFHAISHENQEAPQRLLGRIEAGQFIGEVCMVDPTSKASASVKALANAQALKVTRESFKAFCATYPSEALEFVLAISKQLGIRLRQANERVL